MVSQLKRYWRPVVFTEAFIVPLSQLNFILAKLRVERLHLPHGRPINCVVNATSTGSEEPPVVLVFPLNSADAQETWRRGSPPAYEVHLIPPVDTRTNSVPLG